MYYHIEGARCAGVPEQNHPTHAFIYTSIDGGGLISCIYKMYVCFWYEVRASLYNYACRIHRQPFRWSAAAADGNSCLAITAPPGTSGLLSLTGYWPSNGCWYIINHLHSHFGMQYPPLNAGFSSPLLLERTLQWVPKAEGHPKPTEIENWSGSVGRCCRWHHCGSPWDCWLAFTGLSLEEPVLPVATSSSAPFFLLPPKTGLLVRGKQGVEI